MRPSPIFQKKNDMTLLTSVEVLILPNRGASYHLHIHQSTSGVHSGTILPTRQSEVENQDRTSDWILILEGLPYVHLARHSSGTLCNRTVDMCGLENG